MILFLLVISESLGEFRVPFTQTPAQKESLANSLKKYSPGIYIDNCDKGECAYARKDFDIRDILITLPVTETLSELDSTRLKLPGTPKHLKLYLNILYYKYMDNSTSLISSAINSYPLEYYTPINWTESEIEFYQSLSLFQFPLEASQDFKKDCEEFSLKYKNQDIPQELFECESWKWAHLVVKTRSFGISLQQYQSTGRFIHIQDPPSTVYETMIPIADLLNHIGRNPKSVGVEIFTFNKNPSRMNFNAILSFRRGDEVFNQYGPFNNYVLLNKYGFIEKKNYDNKIVMHTDQSNFCTGLPIENACQHELLTHEFNKNLLLQLANVKSNGFYNSKLEQVINMIVGKKIDVPITRKETESILYALLTYKSMVDVMYRDSQAMPLRELRRKHSKQTSFVKQLIYDYSEDERDYYFQIRGFIDRDFLFYLHHVLFK